jgi:hypothetical protein
MENCRSSILNSIEEASLLIDTASLIGNDNISFFYPAKKALKLKTKLRKNSFYVESVTFKSSPEQEFITVVWDSRILASHERTMEIDE